MQPSLRVFCTSDVHIDYAPNMEWVRNLSNTEYIHDALIVAGDGTALLVLHYEWFMHRALIQKSCRLISL